MTSSSLEVMTDDSNKKPINSFALYANGEVYRKFFVCPAERWCFDAVKFFGYSPCVFDALDLDGSGVLSPYIYPTMGEAIAHSKEVVDDQIQLYTEDGLTYLLEKIPDGMKSES